MSAPTLTEEHERAIDWIVAKITAGFSVVTDVQNRGDRVTFTIFKGDAQHERRITIACIESVKPQRTDEP